MSSAFEKNTTTLIDWAESCLPAPIQKIEEIISTDYSYVFKLETKEARYYLKNTPKRLFIESDILKQLREECGVVTIPKIISTNKNLSCFITMSCGDQTLREFLNTQINSNLLIQGVDHYKTIQKATINHTQNFLNQDIPDWRLKNFIKIYNTLLSDDISMNTWKISAKENDLLKNNQNFLIETCEKLDAYGLPSVLNHSDFQDNNMLIDHASNGITIIDWGEVNIGNPLLSLNSCLYSASKVYGLKPNNDDYNILQASFLKGWDIEEKEFKHIIDLLNILAPIYYVFTLHELIKRTGHDIPKLNDRIKSAFLMFMDKNDNI